MALNAYVCLKSFFNALILAAAIFHLLITFANSLDSDQDQQNVGPGLDPVG